MQTKATAKNIRVVELFAGVGGFRVGLERCDSAVFKTVWANQWEPGQAGQWAYKCYEQRFGAASNCCNADIATVIEKVPSHDLLVGGFPCQDYSVASTGAKGIEGKKGVLWWSINDIIKAKQPKYVLLENVDRLLKSPAKQRGRDFGIILKCLDDAGYAVEWRVINAADYGEVQRRRRTFIFACKDSTKQYKRMKKELSANGWSAWLQKDGFFATPFPVQPSSPKKSDVASTDLSEFEDLIAITERFHLAFQSSGCMIGGKIYTEALTPAPATAQAPKLLRDVVCSGDIDEHFFISAAEMPKWEYLKGPKRLSRKSRTGFEYTFSEGGIAFPDPLDRPARTMLTSEGTTNRSSHVIEDVKTGRYRKLTPEECERINGFDVGWTDTEMPERQRYFIMGNALVVPLIEKMGARLLEII